MKKHALGLVSVILLLIPMSVEADIVLDFNSLPSAQGWSVFSTVSETAAYTATGTSLLLDTRTLGTNFAIYRQSVAAAEMAGLFSIDFRAKVTAHEFPSAGPGLYFDAFTGTTRYSLTFDIGSVGTFNEGTIAMVDTSVFHDYRLEMSGNTGYDLFIDGAYVTSGVGHASPQGPFLNFGDGLYAQNVAAEITSYQFNAVPEPSSLAMLAIGCISAFPRRRRNS